MEQPPKNFIPGPSKIPLTSSPGKEKTAWKLPSGSDVYHASTDASLFSTSLPVLSHGKFNFNGSEQSGQFLDDDFPSLGKLNLEGEVKDPLEDIEPSMIGSNLPGDEDELLAGLMDDFDLSGLPTQLEDLDDDLFGSGGDWKLNLVVQRICGEHPYGEHPSRTLFVRNINSNVEDSELKSLFEQYGDIRTLYTACKHRGFVMISYYDIRAARNAMRGLQKKPLRRRKLDIHFSIPKDNPSEKDVNQGTLVVFNLDASVSNDELRQIFGAYGEVKEIRETPHKRHHKFIEFYDVRAAEAALKALNRSDIAGKRIKLEPSRPGGARRSLMLQLSQEQEQDEVRSLRHQSDAELRRAQPCRKQSLVWFGLYSSFSRIKSCQDCTHWQRSCKNKPFKSVSLGSPTIHSEQNTSSAWSSSLKARPFPSRGRGIGFPYTSQHGSFLGSQYHHHVGSAPSGIPLERHFGFYPDSPESSYINQAAFGVPNFGHSNGNPAVNIGAPGAMNIGVAFAGSFTESGSPSSRIMSMSRNGPIYFGNGSVGGMGATNNDGIIDRGRSRRADGGSQMDNKKQYQLDLDKIISGEDVRTTLMIKNIPNKYTSKMLLAAIDETHKGTYDFLYLPIDFKNKCNVGYAFINMVAPSHIITFYEGKTALISHFQNSSLMNEDKRCRPIVFQSEGQDNGDLDAFPTGNLNIFIRQPDGSYAGDSLDSPKGVIQTRSDRN
ncbi:UNVERIFIED_CONTAM: protein MEI2-like 2 [Sesamum latifolium]|uniref:Protein MEI2-like 2 n=1 Tax=Sesamum latifolium TaxID=2727402 RepID=A0AAW2WUV0_9LAMI